MRWRMPWRRCVPISPDRVGCGVCSAAGERDSGKRSLMAAVAERHADRLVVTDDNPRGENRQRSASRSWPVSRRRAPASLESGGRAAAIAWVLAETGPDDVVLVAGKGHETYQEIGGVRHPFSDVEEVTVALGGGRPWHEPMRSRHSVRSGR
ncbi:hypothetical protein DSL92_03065 [Billgrantia gudaonensis]|uniref:Mur ligase C-terminal domain-containing protein n=1 Tax=Billgrantia gudaonensis TaxID=376427 RepID=A0A432JKW6_9GAMM|nr:hypothetical protein DSL92_03065 [Halomonas gudaonensis]